MIGGYFGEEFGLGGFIKFQQCDKLLLIYYFVTAYSKD